MTVREYESGERFSEVSSYDINAKQFRRSGKMRKSQEKWIPGDIEWRIWSRHLVIDSYTDSKSLAKQGKPERDKSKSTHPSGQQ